MTTNLTARERNEHDFIILGSLRYGGWHGVFWEITTVQQVLILHYVMNLYENFFFRWNGETVHSAMQKFRCVCLMRVKTSNSSSQLVLAI